MIYMNYYLIMMAVALIKKKNPTCLTIFYFDLYKTQNDMPACTYSGYPISNNLFIKSFYVQNIGNFWV